MKTAAGKRQYELNLFGGRGEPFMMLISDMCLVWDAEFKKHLDWYNRHRHDFAADAAVAWKRLTELGVPEGQLREEAPRMEAGGGRGRRRMY